MKRPMILSHVLAVAVAIGGVIAVAAQTDAIDARKSIMKNNGKNFKAAVAMVRGEQPFDPEKAKAALAAFADAGRKMPDLFPDDSKSGKTDASPKIWQRMSDVKARFAKLEQDAAAAQDNVKDLGAFKTSMQAINNDCRDCHELYRIRRR
jgi:cytochrome c556